MSNDITISRKRWKQHRKYIRRLIRKERAKSLRVDELTRELRGLSRFSRLFFAWIHDYASKLTPDDAKKIRDMSQQGQTQRELAKKFGVSQAQIGNIVHRRNWGNV